MRADVTILQKHASDFWLARGAIALTAALNLFLVNNLTIGPRWLVPAFEIGLCCKHGARPRGVTQLGD